MYQQWRKVYGGTQRSGAGFIVPAPSGTPYILTQTLGTDHDGGFGLSLGMRFVPTATNVVTQLGRWVISGNNQTHTLYLMQYDGSWHNLANCTIDTNGATPGQYLYCTLSSPQTIDTSMSYVAVLSSESGSGGDHVYLEDTTIDSVTSGIGTMNAAITDSTPPTNPTVAASGSVSYGPVNLKVQ